MLRSIFFNSIFWLIFVCYLLAFYPFTLFFTQEQTFKFMYRPLAKILLFCLKYFAKITFKEKNLNILRDALKKSPVIIGCHHQSTWETFIFALYFNDLTIVVKEELFSVPVAGLYFKRLGCLPVDRSSPIKAIKSLMRFGKEAVKSGKSILIFPNGTRSSIEDNAEYKGGIFALYKTLKIPVVPVRLNSGEHWSRRSFKKIPGEIFLDFKNPIQPGFEKDDFFELFESSMKN